MADFNVDFSGANEFNVTFESDGNFDAGFGNIEVVQVGHYTPLPDKPSINGTTLVGDKTSDEIHVQHKMNRITEQMIDELLFGRN